MSNPCSSSKPSQSTRTRMSELISTRLLRKNPSGALIWGILGASLLVDGCFWGSFLLRKEYQVDHKKRMWNERFEMLENPTRMKLFYPSEESVPKPSQPLIDVYEKMQEAEAIRRQKIEECIRAFDAQR